MAAITDPILTTFVDQHIRPRAEGLRAAEAMIGDLEDAWNNLGGAGAATGTDTIENRTAEGLPDLTWDEVTNIVAALQAERDVVTETGGRAALIEKACVRPLEVTT